MGNKVHPYGLRLGIIKEWQAKWYAQKDFSKFLLEDMRIRQAVESRYADGGISRIIIERQANQIVVDIHTSRPGIVIGRGGQKVEETRNHLEKLIGKKIKLNILEVKRPELDSTLVAKNIAEQIEKRVAYRRAMKQAMSRAIQGGAEGIKVQCAGRLGGNEIARREVLRQGRVPLHTLRADIDYGLVEAHTMMGSIGVKVWIYKGDILKELPKKEAPGASIITREAMAKDVTAKEG